MRSTKTKIIALTGRRGVGKTLLSNYLIESRDYQDIQKLSFAHDLKYLADKVFEGVTDGPKEKAYSPFEWTPREFLVDFGNLIRKYDPLYWIRQVEEYTHDEEITIIDDLRYPDEYKALRKWGATIIRIERNTTPYDGNTKLKLQDSESHIGKFKVDYTITAKQNQTRKGLFRAGDGIFKQIMVM